MKVDELPHKYDNPHVWLTGSRLYGLNNEDSDYDYTGVYFDKGMHIDPFMDTHVTKTYEANNLTMHSAAKFANLLRKGNPNIVELVFAAPVIESRWGKMMMERVQPHVVTRNLAGANMGYLNEQIRRGFKPSTPQNPQRKAQLEELGYDAKYIMHFLRLSYTLQNILLHGEYRVLTEDERSFLMRVRSGEFPKEEMMAACMDEFTSVEKHYESRREQLPDNEKLEDVLRSFFYDWIYEEIRG